VIWAEYPWEGFDFGVYDGAVGAPSVILEGSTYKMWYSGISTDGTPAIGYAFNNGSGWNKPGTTPVLTGGTAAWDGQGGGAPSVIPDGLGGYKAWYTGIGNNLKPTIGYATSANGIIWTNWQQVMLPAGVGWESWGVSLPSVIQEGPNSYKMWYTGHSGFYPGQIGYATSTDGTNWTNRQSVLSGGTWDDGGVFGCCVKNVSGIYRMYYSGYASGGPIRPRIGRADSLDGVTNWIKSADNPELGAGGAGEWDEIGVATPYFLIKGISVEMWYTGCSSEGVFKIGYASQTFPNVPANSNLSTAGLIAGFVVLIAGISLWNVRRNRLLNR